MTDAHGSIFVRLLRRAREVFNQTRPQAPLTVRVVVKALAGLLANPAEFFHEQLDHRRRRWRGVGGAKIGARLHDDLVHQVQRHLVHGNRRNPGQGNASGIGDGQLAQVHVTVAQPRRAAGGE